MEMSVLVQIGLSFPVAVGIAVIGRAGCCPSISGIGCVRAIACRRDAGLSTGSGTCCVILAVEKAVSCRAVLLIGSCRHRRAAFSAVLGRRSTHGVGAVNWRAVALFSGIRAAGGKKKRDPCCEG